MCITRKIPFCLLVFNIQIIVLLLNAPCQIAAAKVIEICTLCRCVNETGIEKIHCDFIEDKEYKLGDGVLFPPKANAINISLGDNSKLELSEGLFSTRNNINSLSIQGLKNDYKMSNNQVVLTKRSLTGIKGGLPEISFKNIKRVTLFEKSLDDAYEIVLFVENIWKVTVEKEVFGSTSYNATFTDIAELKLNEDFLKTSVPIKRFLNLFVNRCKIENLLPMRGTTLTEFRIENSEIEMIKSKAFSMSEIDSLVMNNVIIQSIEKDIFRVGATLQNLAVTNCRIGKIESKAIHDIGIGTFTFEKNSVDSIIENSIDFQGVNVNMSHNEIKKTEPDWFKASETSTITITNNTFGTFDSMILEGSSSMTCIFDHNIFTTVIENSFKRISSKCPYKQLIFHENCNCKFLTYIKDRFDESLVDIKKLEDEIYCTLKGNDDLVKCLNADIVKFEQYYDQKCSTSKKGRRLNCKHVKVEKIDAQFVDPKILSDDIEWMEYIHYIIGGCALIILLPCLFCLIFKKNKTRRDENYNTNNNFHHGNNHQTDLMHLNQSEGPPSYEASLRSTKSFSNHDRIIIKQTLDIMKQKQPEDKYEMVYNNTQRLLHEHLNEYEKVKIIGDIVQTIGECENCGEDFVAFTDILYKHLAPDTTTTLRNTTASNIQQQQQHVNILDDLYSEPVLPQPSNTARREYSKQNSEHIYAEPTVLTQQQTLMPLLLANNYSNPLDSNTNNNNNSNSSNNNNINNVYSEPIMHDNAIASTSLGSFKPKVATPYAISHTIDQPSTSKNLPDIINRVEAGSSGNAQKSKPINRITRSPTTNRKIPEYTVPSTSHKVPVLVTQDNIEDWSDESMENSASSNHSGGSNATVKIDELLE